MELQRSMRESMRVPSRSKTRRRGVEDGIKRV
jgi:hypothetical protein